MNKNMIYCNKINCLKSGMFTICATLLFSFSSLFAQKIEITPVEFNSSTDDFAPAITQNGRKIYYTSDRTKNRQKVYVVEKTSSGWSMPTEIEGDVNDGRENGSVTLTPDGQYMIFAAYKHSISSEGRTDLYSARKVKGKWTDVQNLGPAVNSPYWDTQPSISSDGNTLFFVSDRPGGQGGTDIWISQRTREGWTKPVNAGSAINSSHDEISPIIAPDSKTFTFASDRPGGQGGFDIYFAKYNQGSFGSVKNAGEPINSKADECFYVPLQNTNVALLSSSRSGGAGALDVYTVVPNPFPSDAVVFVNGTVYDADTKESLGANIYVTDLKTGKRVATFNSDDQNGTYYIVLQPGRTYSITAQKPGYLFYSERFEIPAEEKGRETVKDIAISKTDTRLLIFFDYDKTALKEESNPELERIVEFLRDNPNVNISLEGHTDDVGPDSYNDKLSLDRANAVRDYLVQAGIDGDRIKTKGYGKRKPLIKEKTDEARASNRRVELKISK